MAEQQNKGGASKRVALITGCALRDGIGAASARALAEAGFAVVVSDISVGGVTPRVGQELAATEWRGLDSLVEEIRAEGGTAAKTVGDISSEADAHRMVQETVDTFGSVDVLLNNAAASQRFADIEDMSLADFERVFAVNMTGTFLMTRAAVKHMRAKGWGRVINIASVSAEMGGATHSAFSASKAAIIGFTKAVAGDVGPQGITVNAICPGLILTARGRMATEHFGAESIPVRRHGIPEDIAAVAVFLASDASSYLSGEAIRVQGGGFDLGAGKHERDKKVGGASAPTDLQEVGA